MGKNIAVVEPIAGV